MTEKIEKILIVAHPGTGPQRNLYQAETHMGSKSVREAFAEGVDWLLRAHLAVGGRVAAYRLDSDDPVNAVLEVIIRPWNDT